MDEAPEPLAMTVHLLANAGHGALLQQTLDQLLRAVCPQVRLFLVSERASPARDHDRGHSRRSRFPAMSVLLFVHEGLGDQRLLRVLASLQRWPWQRYPGQQASARPCPYLLAKQDFYSLDSQMPVWGVRQVRRGAESLRVTVYCSFDNYEDAIRLYEMILRRDAILQKSNLCVFVLYATEGFALQLSLKQLPLGVSVDPKESSVLQFRVQEIGQLVPLLPHPCVPISHTRWQTQDYDGNKILLQVQPSPGLSVRNGELSYLDSISGADTLPLCFRLTPVSAGRTLEPRSRRSRSRRFRVRSMELPEPGGHPAPDGSKNTPWKSLGCSAPACTQLHFPSSHPESGVKMKAERENSFEKLEAETNVDTGFTVVKAEPRPSFLSRFPRGLCTNQLPSCVSTSFLGTAVSHHTGSIKERVSAFSLADQRELGTRKIISRCPLHLPIQSEGKEEEEFFI